MSLAGPLEPLLDQVPASWRPVVDRWRASAEGRALLAFIACRQAAGATIYPADVLRALALTPLADVRAVILGQDPYHGAGQAEGLAFSVPPGIALPPSLRSIFKEQARDLGLPPKRSGHLGGWARQGVLLLNTSLTVEEGRAGSHAKRGWEALTDAVIAAVAREPRPIAFLLWGAHAQSKAPLIDERRHLVLRSNHPSPLSATRPPVPFIGCGHFGVANRFLEAADEAPIDWSA